MRLGIIISVLLVAFLVFLFVALSGGAADSPTSATSKEKLKEFKLKAGLPEMYTVSSPESQSGPMYEALLSKVNANKRYQEDSVPDTLVEGVVADLIAASEAASPSAGFLDDKIPMVPSGEPKFGAALEVVSELALKHSSKLVERGEPSRAVRILRANWALGQRCFELSRRLYPRRIGMDIMLGTCDQLNQISEQDSALPGQLKEWTPELEKLRLAWNPKVELVQNIRPQIGDLVNVAANEQDLAFRTEAVLQLGLKKFAPAGKKGNKKAIEELIAKLKDDEEPQIAKAAKAASEMTLESVGKVR